MIGVPAMTSKLEFSNFEKYFAKLTSTNPNIQSGYENFRGNFVYALPGKIGNSKKRKQSTTNGLFTRLKRGKIFRKFDGFWIISGAGSDLRLITISIDKYPTFIGLINENCTISTIKQICISTFCLNGFTMLETDLRILYAAENLSGQTGMILTHSPSKLVFIRYDRVVFIFTEIQ